jgi:hypothetical protein
MRLLRTVNPRVVERVERWVARGASSGASWSRFVFDVD